MRFRRALLAIALVRVAATALGSVYAGAPTGVADTLRAAAEDPLPFIVRLVLGGGVPTDFVLAHMWLNIAAANGHEDAGPGRNGLELLMSHADISRATELARACMASNYRDCPPRGLHRNQGWTAKHRPPSSDAHRPERRNIHEVDSEPAAAAPPEVASRRPARSSGPVPASSTPGCSAR